MMLSDVCLTSDVRRLSRTSGLSREQRPRKTRIGIEVAYLTRDSDKKVKRSKVKVTRLTAALTRQAAAAVNVGTY